MRYKITSADCAPLSKTYKSEARYLGYRQADQATPYAHFFRERTLPVQSQAREALIAGPVSSEWGLRLSEAVSVLSSPGYLPCETGYTVNADGLIVVSVLTHMPEVTGEMWDWWFGWHGAESARYKLWHPDAHVYTSMGEDRSRLPGLTDRQRYVGNVSYVDEYLGSDLSPLSVRFIDPEQFGFSSSRVGETVIVARGGLSTIPVAFAWLIHQVRATEDGSEMRSRFFVNDVNLLNLPAHSIGSKFGKALTSPMTRLSIAPLVRRAARRQLREFGPDMLYHCASEMNHLATFLPQLYREFANER